MRRKVLFECGGMKVCGMNGTDAADMAGWKYPAEYSLYDFGGIEEERNALFAGDHFGVTENGRLIGMIAIGLPAQIPSKSVRKIYEDESFTDIALGLRPELCGKGKGLAFLDTAARFAKDVFPDDGIRLTVDTANARAVKVYESYGFREIKRFIGVVTVAGGARKRRKFIIMTLQP